MTEQHGIKFASDAELMEAIQGLQRQARAAELHSPTWKAMIYWQYRAEAELEDRYKPASVLDNDFDDDVPVMDRGFLWGSRDDRPLTAFFTGRDYGDEG